MKTNFCEFSPGVKSVTRLVFLIGFLWLFAITSYLCYLGTYSLLEIGTFFLTISGILTTLKIWQNDQENKSDKQEAPKP